MEIVKVKKAKRAKKEKRKRDSLNGRHKSSSHRSSSSSKPSKRTKVEFKSPVKEELYNPTKPPKPSVPVTSLINDSSSQYSHLNLKVSNPSPENDPIVVSFPSGLPSSLITNSGIGGNNDEGNDSDDERGEPDNSPDLPTFTWHNSRAGAGHIGVHFRQCTYAMCRAPMDPL